jgi:hypothetical protein
MNFKIEGLDSRIRVHFKILKSLFCVPIELHVLITYTYRQIKFRMKVHNKIDTYKNKSTTTMNKI